MSSHTNPKDNMSEQTKLAMRTDEFGGMMEMSKTLIASGFLPTSIKTPAQAVAIMMMGRELQIPPMQALRQINVIQGKPTMSVELMLSLAYQRIPGFKCVPVETDATHAVFDFTRPGMDKAYRHTFTMDDAKSLGLTGKDNWNKQPATMLRWRCISGGLRLIAPDAIAGIYSPEEIDPTIKVSEDGEVDHEHLPPPPAVVDQPKAIEPAREPASASSELPANVVVGKIETISVKDGGTEQKPWTKYGVKVNGEWYGTFDKDDGQCAEAAKRDDLEVKITWEQNGKYKNAVAIEAVDDLPM